MTDATPLPFELPAVRTKKLTVDFDGGNQSSDAGMLLLRGAAKKTGILARLAAAFRDRRDQRAGAGARGGESEIGDFRRQMGRA